MLQLLIIHSVPIFIYFFQFLKWNHKPEGNTFFFSLLPDAYNGSIAHKEDICYFICDPQETDGE